MTQAGAALAILRCLCRPDPVYPFGTVRSIYLDTPNRRSFTEKWEGDHRKRKLRVRWYEVVPEERSFDVTVFLETKDRIGSGRIKTRIPFTVPRDWLETRPLHHPALRSLIVAKALESSVPVSPDLLPMIGITYDRHRFVCSRTGARVNLDLDIRADRFHRGWLPAVAPAILSTAVCEFKGAALGDLNWAGELHRAGFRMRSFSKYAECMERTIQGGRLTS